MNKKLYSYRVMAFNSEDTKNQRLEDVCACEVIAEDEKGAISVAKKMVNKKYYHVREARDIEELHKYHV